MKFDIARQPFVPAFLTLLALAAAFVCTIGPEFGPEAAAALKAGPATAGLALAMPDRLLLSFQTAHPVWSKTVTVLCILITGLAAGRLAVRYNLYSVTSCLSIGLYALFACAIGGGTTYLASFVAATFLGLSVKNFARAFCNGYAFDALFRASLYLGLTVLTAPAALPLLLLLPLSVVLFRRTLRETVVAAAGLLAGPLAFAYLNWGLGGAFTAPLAYAFDSFLTGVPLGLFASLPPERIAALAGILLLDIAGIFCLLSDLYAVGTKARFILLFHTGALLLCGLLLPGPAAASGTALLAAFPSAVLLPFLFVRMHRAVSTPLYLLLLAAAVAGILLQ